MSETEPCPNCGVELMGYADIVNIVRDENANYPGNIFTIIDGKLCIAVSVTCPDCGWSDERVFRGEEYNE